MKKFTLYFFLSALFHFLFFLLPSPLEGEGLGARCVAQAPPSGINYQAVARDVSGSPLASQTVTVVFTVHSNNPTGPTAYTESQNSTTNQFGLFTLTIGVVDPATFSGIQWNTDKFFLEVNVNGIPMGTTQFLSVPYAYHSKTADSVTSSTLRAWTKSADTLRTSFLNDYVGIGTASPKEKLHIAKPAGGMDPHILLESTGGSFDIGYKIKTGGSNEWLLGKETGEFDVFKIKWNSSSSSSNFTGFAMRSSGLVGIGTNSPLEFFHVKPDKDGSLDSSFVVTSGGKIGIGTAVPSNKVHIIGTPNTDIVNVSDGTASAAVYVYNASGVAPVQFGSLTNHTLGFFTNNGVGAPAMVIKTNSNVGIGTTSPAVKLDVVSSYTTAPHTIQSSNTASASLTNSLSAVYGLANGNNAAAVSKYGGLFQTQSGSGTNYGVRGDVLGGTGTNYGVYGNANNSLSPGTGTYIGGYFSAVNGANNYAAIFDLGNVGIGTTTPKSKLKVSGSFAPGYIALNVTSYTATPNDCIINFITGGALSLTLPLAASVDAGSIIIVQFASASTTVNRQGGDLICLPGGSCSSLPQAYSSAIRFFSDGSGKWYEW